MVAKCREGKRGRWGQIREVSVGVGEEDTVAVVVEERG